MKNLIANLKLAWAWLDGRKRKIAKFYWGVAIPLVPVFHIALPSTAATIIAAIGAILTGMGYGHDVFKDPEVSNE